MHEYIGPDRRWILESHELLPAGRRELRLDFRKTGNCAGVATLRCDSEAIGELAMQNTWPSAPGGGGVCCGYDEAGPLSDRYAQPFTFSGTIHSVTVEIDSDHEDNLELENHIALSED